RAKTSLRSPRPLTRPMRHAPPARRRASDARRGNFTGVTAQHSVGARPKGRALLFPDGGGAERLTRNVRFLRSVKFLLYVPRVGSASCEATGTKSLHLPAAAGRPIPPLREVVPVIPRSAAGA